MNKNSRYKYYNTVYNTAITASQKGFSTVDFSTLFTSTKDISYTIPLAYKYRPDLIANYFYGDSGLAWILTYVNNFANSPEDYETGVVITIPHYQRVYDLL